MYSEDKFLITIDEEDRTLDIEKIDWSDKTIDIYFCNKPGECYSYGKKGKRVSYYNKPNVIDPNTYRIQWNGNYLNNIEKILDFGKHLRVFYFNEAVGRVYPKSLLKIEKNALGETNIEHMLSYLHSLAKNIGDEENDFLDKQYEKISYVSRQSVLYKYLNGISPEKRDNNHTLIFPFGLNLSQEAAVKKALTHQVSIIEGPPGTGKTQTILNIIVNLIMQNKTVAIASNNNSATKNVYDKLESYGLSFFTSVLGNVDNQKLFFENQNGVYPENFSILENNTYKPSRSELEQRVEKIREMLQAQNDIAKAKKELDDLNLEKKYFMETYVQEDSNIEVYKDKFLGMGMDKMFSLLGEMERLKAMNKEFNFIFKLRSMFKYQIFSFDIYRYTIDSISLLLQKCFYEYQENRLQDFIAEKELFLEGSSYKHLLEQYQEDSMLLLRYHLAQKYDLEVKRKIFDSFVLRSDHQSFTKEYPVILSTTHSLRNCTQEEVLYDYLIIDEASQVDIVAGALALSCAKNVVIVGDNKQLPHVVDKNMQDVSDEIYYVSKPKEWFHFRHSLLSSVSLAWYDAPKTMLKEHYRCHPKIIDFCNKKFYNNELIILSNDDSEGKDPLVFRNTVEGNHARGNSNQRQIDEIKKEIFPFVNLENTGVISPFRAQIERVKKDEEIDQKTGIEIDTVHKYQGREKDIIVITTVVDKENTFADDPNLLNVAISRAKKQLFVVVSDREKNRNMKDLVNYIKYNKFEIIEGKIYSIFDLLYKNYSPYLEKYLHKIKKISKYKSENLMAIVIEEVLSDEIYSNFSYIHNYPLSKLIRDTSLLTLEESNFVYSSSHIDFLIYNMIDKQPVLAVEVDGTTFHANNPQQLMRDQIKNNILNKYEIPLKRFATDGSEEKKKLKEKLKEIV